MHASSVAQQGLSIAEVEQSTGIARATLRIWERRYGFPQPERNARGERSYPEGQVQKLRLIADLMARGHRPGRLVQLGTGQLAELAGPALTRAGGQRPVPVRIDDPVLVPLREHDSPRLLRLLEESLRSMGLDAFVTDRMAAMNVNVGMAWACGDIEVFEEHLYTELVQDLVRRALVGVPQRVCGPRVLLATLPDELHTLGLLMAQAMLTLQGCPCTSLGASVPVLQLVKAAGVFRAQVVGVSFAASMNPSRVLRGLQQLRAALPPPVQVWAGGSSPVLARHHIAGVQTMLHVRDVLPALAQWRLASSAERPSAA